MSNEHSDLKRFRSIIKRIRWSSKSSGFVQEYTEKNLIDSMKYLTNNLQLNISLNQLNFSSPEIKCVKLKYKNEHLLKKYFIYLHINQINRLTYSVLWFFLIKSASSYSNRYMFLLDLD